MNVRVFRCLSTNNAACRHSVYNTQDKNNQSSKAMRALLAFITHVVNFSVSVTHPVIVAMACYVFVEALLRKVPRGYFGGWWCAIGWATARREMQAVQAVGQ